MTTPKQARSGSGSFGGRTYRWPPLPDEQGSYEFEVSSVTTVLGAWPKPQLDRWRVKMVAEAAVSDHAIVGKMIEAGKSDAAVKMLKDAPYAFTGIKADMGTIAHAAVDAYLDGKPLTPAQVDSAMAEAKLPPEKWGATRGYINGAMEFFFDHEPEVLHNEVTVFSRTHGYAGTTDLILRMPITKGGEPVLVIGDFKTSKAIYSEPGLQLVAYARADFIGSDDGVEIPMPTPIRHGLIIQLKPNGTYQLHPFSLSDELYEAFLACKVVATSKGVVDNAKRPS